MLKAPTFRNEGRRFKAPGSGPTFPDRFVGDRLWCGIPRTLAARAKFARPSDAFFDGSTSTMVNTRTCFMTMSCYRTSTGVSHSQVKFGENNNMSQFHPVPVCLHVWPLRGPTSFGAGALRPSLWRAGPGGGAAAAAGPPRSRLSTITNELLPRMIFSVSFG